MIKKPADNTEFTKSIELMTRASPKKKVSINSLFMNNSSPKPPVFKKGSMQDVLRASLLTKFKIEKSKIDYQKSRLLDSGEC